MPRGFDVVLHVTDEQCFGRGEAVLRQHIMNFCPLIADLEVMPF